MIIERFKFGTICILFLLVAAILPVLTVSCARTGRQTIESPNLENDGVTDNEKTVLNIMASIPPQAEFLEKIGGNYINVKIIVPPGADPHTFELKPELLKSFSEADAYFKIGSGIEFELTWMDKIAGFNKNMKIYDCSKNIKFIHSDTGSAESDEHADGYITGNDPHIWVSIKNAMIISENIYEGLSRLDPKNSNVFLANRNSYQQKLIDLDKKITESLSGAKNRKFMVYHSAWSYFARDYGMEEISIESSGKEPTFAGIREAIDLARQNNIKIIFVSPQFSTKSAETIAKEIGADIVLIDPLDKNFLSNMEVVAEKFENIFNP
jgi:zinc transport system substrate-binding protein